MKRILIDGSIFSRQVASGISKYLSKIAEHGIVQTDVKGMNCRILLPHPSPANIFFRHIQGHTSLFLPASASKFYSQIFLGGISPQPQVFHSPYMFLPPRRNGTLNLLTVHDLINLQQPFSVRGSFRASLLRLAISRADHFICISKTTKDELLRIYPSIIDEKIHVIPQGIDDIFIGNDPGEEFRPAGERPYMLYVGVRDGYKNFSALIDFYGQSDWKKTVDLVCVGGGPFSAREVNAFKQLRIEGQVHHAGFISTSQLKFLYRNALVFVYTSLAEGFGLPILEAMASGCPVICGDFSSMKEVSNGKSIAVPDFSHRSLQAAMTAALAFTNEQREVARQHAKNFSWQRTAAATIALYHSL